MKTILDKEETIKKIKSQLKPCNDGSCPISRQGKSHLSHHKINKSYIRLAVTLLASLEVLLLIITIIIKDPHDPVNNITIFLAAIPFAGFTIWYSRQLHKDQKQYSEFLQYKETMNYSGMKGEWDKVIENGKIALQYLPLDLSILHSVASAYMNLEEYENALIYFEQIRKLA